MSLSVRDAIRLMIAYSDNTATNLVLDQIGLPATAEAMGKLGCPNTKIHAKVFRADTSIFPDRSQQFGLGSTTAGEMVRLLELLQKHELVSGEACDAMLEHLTACEDKEKFPADLPAGTKLAHKTGSVAAIRTDAGIIETPSGPIAVCVLTSQNKDQRWSPENAGNVLCANVARAVYDFFNTDEGPDKTDPKVLQLGATGDLVETLQRTLNARLKPSPKLSIDGDFGTTTQGVVIRFQKEHHLPTTGIVSLEVWRLLSPLVLPPASVPEPDVVNSQVLPRKPADPTSGPPIVTAKAWAAGDLTTGKILHHEDGDDRLPMASTTKVMTALVVMNFAAKDPKVLDEVIEFSHRADRTGGTSSGVKAGERLPVRELLYGLMLPSGNDAAVAFGEHFGDRCAPPADAPKTQDPLIKFIAEMNRTAAKLGLKNTHFANPHGLPDKTHYSSANDLLQIAVAASRFKTLTDCASCRQHGCKLSGPEGYQRNIVWKNTNELLEIEGYRGLKTGTTTAAGACLISSAENQGRKLVVVVLGCTASENRYLDTRNLFKWAWSQK
jgi:D-alanyl-D-alanine carboxypeptidase (penicillin-binding protein 5/6)